MKILLINPAFGYYSRHLLIGEPLSLGYLAAYLREFGYTVNILDCVAGKITKQEKEWHFGLMDHEVIERVKDFKPDLVGITCPFSLRIDSTLNVAKLVKRIDKKIITVIGGIHPTIFPLETVCHDEVDYVIIGEGEESLFSLVKHIESGRNFDEITVDGCAYKSNIAKMIPKVSFIENLDSIPFPARDLMPMEFYINRHTILYGLGKRRSASIITSRSCPKRCTFCSMYQSHGTVWRARSAKNVFEEIKLLYEKYRIEELFFNDDNLTFDKERMKELCELIIRNGITLRWNTPNGISAQSLDSELAVLMKRSGCVNICIGVEAGNDRVRNRIIKKGLSVETIRNTLNICTKAGLPVVGFFILGIPGENEDSFKDTIRMVKELPFSMIATSFFTPFPGTKLYEECLAKGYINKNHPKNIDKFNAPIVETPDFNKETLRKWEKMIYCEFIKSHFWKRVFLTVTKRNEFFKLEQIKRFIIEKFAF